MSECTGNTVSQQDIRELLALLGDSLASYLARDEVVHIDRLGTFYCNARGWIRFVPSRRMKEQTTSIRAQRSRFRR